MSAGGRAVRKVRVDFFTHPICGGCWDVGEMLRQLAERRPDTLEVHRWSLAVPSGRARAQALGVMEVPTVVIDGQERIVGVPESPAALEARVLAAAREPAGGGSGSEDTGRR